MNRLLLSSLQFRLILGVTLLFLASLWGFALLLARQQTVLLEQLLIEQQRATIGYVAADLDERLRRRLDILAQAAAVVPLEQLGDPARLEDMLRERPNLTNLFDGGIIIVKPDGAGAFADYPPLAGRREQDFAHFAAVGDVIHTGRPAVGKPFVAPLLGKPVLGFAMPVRDKEGHLVAILAGVSSLQAPNLLGIVSQHRYGKTGDFMVIAPQHDMVVIGSDPADTLRALPQPGVNIMLDRFRAGHEGSGISVNLKGIEQLVSGQRLSTVDGWFVVARLPAAEAFAPIAPLRHMVFGGALLLSLLVAGLAALWVRRALKPLLDATMALDAISAGTAPLQALPVARQDEVGRLAESFNRLQQRLGQREADLIAAREELREIADSVPVAVYRYRIEDDGHPRVLYVSDRIEPLCGVSAAVAMRDAGTLFARIHPEDQAGFSAAASAAWAAQSPSSHELRIVKPDGGIRWLHMQSEPKRLADGRMVNHGFVEDITARKAADAALQQLQERFAVAFRASPIAASIGRAADGRLIEVNDKWLRDFGWTRAELIGKSALGLGIWPDAALRNVFVEALRRDGSVFDHVTHWRRKDGALRDVNVSAEMLEIDGEPCILAFATDITDRLQAERALAESEARNRRIVETANEGIWVINPDARVSYVNQRMVDMLGYAQDEILGRRAEDFLYPEDLAEHRQHMALRAQGQGSSYERRFRRQDGSELWTQVSGTAIMNPDGSYGGAFGMFTDISHLKAQQRQLEHIAHYDALTGIPNRVLLADRMQLALAQARRAERLMAVCYVDLDGFKPINDAFGHEAGDRLLVEIAHRLREGLRSGDTVARLGGDEFVLLLGIERREECDTALRRVLDAIAQPLSVAGSPVTISASIGVTLFPLDDADPDTLLRHADQAMYGAKQEGRNRYQLFDPERDRAVRAHREAQERIAAGLDAAEFVLHYQPKVNMRAGSVVGVEALIRWQHPLHGLLPPADFLPLIEDTDLIVQLGEWVIDAALRQWQAWQAQGLDLSVSVNIAARHLSQHDFVARLTALLRAHPALPPHRLELEVLETAALEDIGRVARIIEECRELGVSFALDDFGTGYSSLTYIKRLPAETLKIDQSFVRDMLRDPEDCAIVEGVIGLAWVFHRTVVAEGVETIEHGTLLLSLGCNIAQGYGIARPMPAAALIDWVRNWQPDPVWVANAGLSGHSDDLPLAIAEAGHRRWVEEVEACLCDNAREPETDPRFCHIGQWLAGTGQQHYGKRPEFAEVSRLHRQVHDLAMELLAQQRNGTGTAVCQRMPELHGARDALLAALPRLIDDSTAA
ncbi:MAG: EAL domain-containing protein [Gammaproteobacteria bacterium]|nr:EAL domain-containing protein [Rhodocyclaceae bacterium]MBU3909354.1 EAL domain-containing protein [Gammaproteobacteria bacterium]MBU4005486.1 EAL domain-containing protein [Gammaproteobacteria bacterium]MBU4020961.1 EAL domain-containing protein [Gammaproteobacteria bacterium]MBU4096780.1 EAL domain-containing protein [Gammaproteobacteria bacterium]